MPSYIVHFKLTGPVNDVAAANEYLDRSNIIIGQILSDETIPIQFHPHDLITQAYWRLDGPDSGTIHIHAYRELDDDGLRRVCEWVSGQCAYGIGKGFGQQRFARDKNGETIASFDWKTNKYPLQPVA